MTLISCSTAFLCGFFTTSLSNKEIGFRIADEWTPFKADDSELEEMKDFYYGDFIDFMTGTVITYTHKIRDDIRLYVFPLGIIIFSIKVVNRNIEYNALSAMLQKMRNNCYYNPCDMQGFMDRVIEPLCLAYSKIRGNYKTTMRTGYGGINLIGYPFLMENGNKFKLFHIMTTSEYSSDNSVSDVLLYESGTLSREGSYKSDDFMSCTPEYFQTIMRKNKIAVFNNWKALALFDNFTILSGSEQTYLTVNWENIYFGKIYLYCIFRKFYLFHLNMLFRCEENNLSALKDEYIEFERKYCFPRISYNFLPLEIMNSIEVALDINKDKDEMYCMLKQENQIREEQAERKMNKLLFFLTSLTIFSAVWDLGCLLDSMYPFEISLGSSMVGFRIVTLVLFLITLLVVVVSRRRP